MDPARSNGPTNLNTLSNLPAGLVRPSIAQNYAPRAGYTGICKSGTIQVDAVDTSAWAFTAARMIVERKREATWRIPRGTMGRGRPERGSPAPHSAWKPVPA